MAKNLKKIVAIPTGQESEVRSQKSEVRKRKVTGGLPFLTSDL
jgi:hypothetical protein